MGNELATGYVSIVADTSKLARGVAREFDAIARASVSYGKNIGRQVSMGASQVKPFSGMAKDGAKSGTDTGKAFTRAATSEMRSGGKSAGSAFKSMLGAMLTSQAITSVLGGVRSALSTLIPEVTAASDATDKFKSTLNFAGIDSSAIEQLTKSTKDYADRTVYDLGDIQRTTAQLAANGVTGYADLAEAAGNLNAVAGGSKDTFKSVAMMLTQTAGAGKLTTENWNQLADAIPGASGMLQEAMRKNGAFTGNFREAMEKGEISAEEFNAAISELGMTDAAKDAATATTTFEGALGNLKASAVSGIMGPLNALKPAITTALSGFATMLGPVFDKLTGFVERFAPKLQTAAESFAGWAGTFTLDGAFAGVRDILGGVLDTVKDFVGGFRDGFGDLGDGTG